MIRDAEIFIPHMTQAKGEALWVGEFYFLSFTLYESAREKVGYVCTRTRIMDQ